MLLSGMEKLWGLGCVLSLVVGNARRGHATHGPVIRQRECCLLGWPSFLSQMSCSLDLIHWLSGSICDLWFLHGIYAFSKATMYVVCSMTWFNDRLFLWLFWFSSSWRTEHRFLSCHTRSWTISTMWSAWGCLFSDIILPNSKNPVRNVFCSHLLHSPLEIIILIENCF